MSILWMSYLSHSLVNMETGIRGYLITGIDQFLEPYHEGQKSFAENIAEIQKLTSDNPMQQQRIAALHSQYQEWTSRYIKPQMALRAAVNEGSVPLATVAESERKAEGKQG